MVLVFYLLCIISMMVIRPCLNQIFLKKGKTAIYCSLYFIPVLSLFHTVAGGLICEYKSMERLAKIHKSQFFYRLLLPISECYHIDDFKCCTFLAKIGSKYEIVDFIVCKGDEEYCRHK